MKVTIDDVHVLDDSASDVRVSLERASSFIFIEIEDDIGTHPCQRVTVRAADLARALSFLSADQSAGT